MNGRIDPPLMLFALFLCLGTALIANADGPAQLAAGGIYMICSLAFAVLA